MTKEPKPAPMDKEFDRVMEQRDMAEEYFGNVYCLVTGNDDAHWSSQHGYKEMVQEMEDKLNELAAAALESVATAPMDRKRVEEIARVCFCHARNNLIASDAEKAVADYLAPLLGVEEPWVKCSERMPENGVTIFAFDRVEVFPSRLKDGYLFVKEDGNGGLNKDYVTHWKPRHVPAPPVEEESELVRDIRKLANDTVASTHIDFNAVIKLLKCYEAKAGKS